MKQINLSFPDLRNINWKSPINCISALSFVGFLVYAFSPSIIVYGGIYNYPVGPIGFIEELALYSFLHGGFWHFISNVIFFLYVGKMIEMLHGFRWTWYLWGWTTVFVGIFLYLFSDSPTIGGSGFAMSLLAVYTYDLYHNHQKEDFKGAILLIVINLLIGFGGGISFLGHFAGSLAGFCYIWYRNKRTHGFIQHFRPR